ncbi:hypothetical protein [Sporomusa sp. KB1]|jgi:hypothetical protein|uniref:hypothetical protein n=1 Tax=Sporomusa sp. KB1 TaxID=943346 RepID=UPI00119E37B7|nr:hypothetical protein [Sporomusa sp. KB1]TWH49585.1 hypothetical protein Salpa_5823 [Sporomusa sp. KB1]
MGAGLQIYNNNNILQIDSAFKNIQFIDKHQITVSSQYVYDGSLGNTLDIRSTSLTLDAYLNSFFACRVENGLSVTWSEIYPKDGSSPGINFIGDNGAIVTIYRFSYASIPAGQCFEVMNSSGERVFSDTAKFLKVLDSRTGYAGGKLSTGYVLGSTSHSSSIKTAVAVGGCYWLTENDNYAQTGYAWRQGYTFNSTETIGFCKQIINGKYMTNYTYKDTRLNYNYHYFVIDVTGL